MEAFVIRELFIAFSGDSHALWTTAQQKIVSS
jgi:hypothetical protein